MYILVGMLVVALICNLMVRPPANKWFMTDEELAVEKKLTYEKAASSELHRSAGGGAGRTPLVPVLHMPDFSTRVVRVKAELH